LTLRAWGSTLLDAAEGEVRRVTAVSFFALALLLVPSVPSYAEGRGRRARHLGSIERV